MSEERKRSLAGLIRNLRRRAAGSQAGPSEEVPRPAEAKAKEGEEKKPAASPGRKRIALLVGAAFGVLGALGAAAFLFRLASSAPPPSPPVVVTSPVLPNPPAPPPADAVAQEGAAEEERGEEPPPPPLAAPPKRNPFKDPEVAPQGEKAQAEPRAAGPSSLAPLPSLPPPPAALPAERAASPPPPPEVACLGVSLGAGEPSAVVRTKEFQGVVSVGEEVPGVGKLIAVRLDGCSFSVGKRTLVVSLEGERRWK